MFWTKKRPCRAKTGRRRIRDFSFGGVIIGIRYWVPSGYFAIRYAVNGAIMTALRDNQIACGNRCCFGGFGILVGG